MAERIMADVARRLPEGRVLRVLEIGAGTGGLTGFVVPSLPPHQTKYVFTDLSRYFFSSAEQRFRDYTFIEYETLDIERDPVSQGFPRHGFDVVLASNVFHAASDLAHVLRYTRQLLAKDGLLVIIELEIDDRWLDLTFGLTEGWWRFSDHDLRPDSPLLTRATWETTLAANGFGETVVLSDSTEAERNLMRNITLLTRATGDDGSADATTDSAAPAPATATWLIFDDENGTARRIGRLLAERGDRTLFVRPTGAYACRTEHEFEIDPASRTDMAQLLHALSGPLTPSGVIYAWPLRVMSEDFTPLSLAAAELFTGHAPLHLVQSLTEGDRTASPQLWILTRCAQPAGATDVNVGQAPMVGLGRTITNEMPRLRCRLVDLGAEDSDTEIRTLIEDLLACDDEEEIALRGEARYVPRLLRRADRLAHVPKPVVSGNEAPWRLAAPRSGAINQLAFQPMQRRVPGPDDVEIEVHAAGLNFRDVMKALGIHPGDAGDALVLGDECAGRVTLVGGNVTHVKPGDAVMAIGAGCFASHLTLPKDFVTPKPAYLSFEEAATMQLVHLTSFYALHHLGRMKAGEKVLIHAAAGGVGLAAIQLAQATGAEVFATAGSQEKRDFLHTLGVEHVMDSRALDFADEILDITGGNGIDLVLNSIAGEAIAKSLSVLGPCGRFLEIGKRDIYGNTHIGLRPFRNNLSYFAIDLSKLMDPAFIGELLQPLFRLFDQRKLRPLPYRAFPVNASADAFRYMTQARQIGKIVITPYGGRVPLDVPPNEHPVKPNDHATYLVVGGAGGFGLAAAHWLVSRGARHVVLASRSASPDAAGRAAIASMEAAGAHVMLMQCDVTSEEDVARILVEIAASGHPLRGVIHSAMVLDDALLSQLDADRFRRVTSPKIHGAWNLHRLTRDLPLDFFVLFSSSSVTIGNPGQGSYCAANAFLDALAHHRRRLGLPGLAVNWGLLAEVGIITRDAELADHFRRMGIEGLPTAAAFDALSLLLSRHATQTTVWNMNWSGWFASGTHVTKAKRFVKLVDASATTTPGDEGSNLREALRAARMEDRMELMQNYLRRQISEILRVPAAKLDLAMPLNVQGMDSLMAVELIHRLESQLGASLTDAALALRPTIVDLSGSLLESIGIPYAKAEADASASAASSEETERVAGDAAARS
jgi:NADPH:quinone reductase-like Zn-dependent oxidoreductase/SAM-dependent methyltransferase/acyl carrier protein